MTKVSDTELLEEWQALIDETLFGWALHPEQFDDEYPIPADETINLAIYVASKLAEGKSPAPSRVVTDANGGIVFERCEDTDFETIRVSSDLSIEYCLFLNGRLVRREPW